MDLATSPYLFDNLIAHNLCGSESDLVSPRASSSLSTGSVVLNPGTPHQTEVCSIALPSCNTLVSNATGDVQSPNTSVKITLNTKAATESLLYNPFSVSNGFRPDEQYWREESNSCTFARNDVRLVKGNPPLNAKQSVPRVFSCGNESGMPNGASALMPERMLQKQHFRYQDGRFMHSTDQQEISSLSQVPPYGRFSGASYGGGSAFGGNSAQANNHIAASKRFMNPHVYANFSKPLQKGLEHKCIQQTLQRDMHMVSDCNLSTSGNPLPVFGLDDGNYISHYIQPNIASNPASFFHNLSFQPQDQVPQFNQVQLRQDSQCKKQPVENLMSHVTNFGGILHEISNPKEENLIPVQMSLDQQMQGTSQKMNEQDMPFLPHPVLGGFTNDRLSSSNRATISNYHSWSPCSSQNAVRKLQDNEKQELLLLYYHARQCPDQGACLNNSCKVMKGFIDHMAFCQKSCSTCFQLHALLGHHRHCQDSNCFVCVPVRKLFCKNTPMRFGMEHFNFSSPMISGDSDASIPLPKALVPNSDQITNLQPFFKRLKTKCTSFENSCQRETSRASKPVNFYVHPSPSEQVSGHFCKSIAAGSAEEIRPCDYSSQGSSTTVCENKFEDSEITDEELPASYKSVLGSEPCENFSEQKSALFCKKKIQDPEVCNMVELAAVPVTAQEIVMEGEKANRQVEAYDNSQVEEKCKAIVSTVDSTVDCSVRTKPRKPNVKGVSLIEAFTGEQVLEHMRSLKQWVGLSKAKVAKNQSVEYVGDKNSCQLCGIGDLLFEPPPIYCVKCYGRIKHNRAYHTMANSESITSGAGRLYLCNPCFNGSHGDSVTYIGGVLSKAKLEKRRNDVQILELWVQCDKCNAWQHQICALFNSKRNVGGQAEYTCPKCYLQEMEEGEGLPLSHGIILGAQDLPTSKLSDHIERRLVVRLEWERQERAESLQKNLDEVPGAEGLIVRVVSSVDKKLEVKQLFRQVFEEENYPTEFPYKSKAVLLFQKIEGADVCLFGMYVQEYGSECSHPNQRRVCLSYLDSVKYFRPDIKTVTGEALRTFVYHEILIGYLDYCKMRGFTSCHIWSCPPLKQEDFILNCHPEIQKTPKPDKLREWYLVMIRKAVKENIVVENTKLYDFFFMPMVECKASITASRLPYFDGDYWPGCADDLLQSLQQIEDGKEPQKKGRMTITKRALKAARHGAVTDSPSKDSLLMFKLGEVIRPMKDDLIMVQLQHSCNHCCQMIISGKRWVCSLCKKFQLCDKCYCAEEKLDQEHKHPINNSEKHSFHPVEVIGVPADTVDEDENLESEFFDSRLAFLNLCQGNHYQYDTLRRAKHSTMMILYHLHNPTAPAFVLSCFHCHNDIETGQGWHCETCPDYDVCNSCYHQEGGVGHSHELVRQTSLGSHDVPQTKGSRQRQAPRIQDLLDLLLHASKCCATRCTYPSCRNVKGLFHHGANCKIRSSGGCASCKKMWYILHLHARTCKEGPECRVPRCRDLKDHLKKMESQSNFRRRFGAMERMRQLEMSTALGDSE